MSEELSEPAGGAADEPAETPADAAPAEPATGAPGGKVFICPACGTRYDEATVCSNGHEPTETVEYDRATVAAAEAGDEAAIAAVNETAAKSVGTSAGVPTASAEAAPAPVGPTAPASAGSVIMETLTAAKDALDRAIAHAASAGL